MPLTKNVKEKVTSKDYYCEKCLCGFLKSSSYKRHMRDQHSFQCNQCNRKYIDKQKLESHISSAHQKEKPFQDYSVSFKSYKKKSELEIHNKSHRGELPFVCNHCGKRFSRKQHFKRHLLFHSGEKPFNCDHCDRSFSQKSDLNRHLRTHTGEKPLNVIIVEKVSHKRPISLIITWSILGKNLLAVITVGIDSPERPISICMRWFILERSLSLVINVGRASHKRSTLRNIHWYILERSVLPAKFPSKVKLVIMIHTFIPPKGCFSRSTRFADSQHSFAVKLEKCRTTSFANSFVPMTSRNWNSLPASIFSSTYNLQTFKTRVYKNLRLHPLDQLSLLFSNARIFRDT